MEINGNGLIKKAKNILGLIVVIGVIGTSIWGYVDNRVNTAIETTETEIRVDFEYKFNMLKRLMDLHESERRLEILLKDECPDKTELKNEYECVRKSIKHIEKKFKHM